MNARPLKRRSIHPAGVVGGFAQAMQGGSAAVDIRAAA
jgi:hypothetical protein